VVVDVEPEEVDVDPVDVDVEPEGVVACVVDETPGIVLALTAPSRPTPAIAPKTRPAVSRLSIRVAASRARILVAVVVSISMVLRLPRGTGSFL
jgi:hypothetical protein